MALKSAKPFPSQIRIGADVAEIQRFYSIIDHCQEKEGTRFARWGRMIFNPLELPQWQHMTTTYLRTQTRHSRSQLALYMAGRWAMKEAAIKAHSRRHLLMAAISVIPCLPEEKLARHMPMKPRILIDPPGRPVLMDKNVAELRGLDMSCRAVSTHYDGIGHYSGTQRDTSDVYVRWAPINMEDRRLADGSLSHDGDYVFAVCQALDEEVDPYTGPLIDDGTGNPIHEPLKTDRGYDSSI